MSKWTEAANKEWERYCDEVRALLSGTGADPNEVIEDMLRHIEAELTKTGAKVVTEQDVQRIIKRIGFPDVEQISDKSMSKLSSKFTSTEAKKKGRGGNVLIIIFGVILPAATLLVELTMGLCAEIFFDPIPTVWHVLLISLVPVANLMVFISEKKNAVNHYKKLGLLNSMAIGVALIYTILFLPILPISAIAMLAYGLGLCGLAPLLSFITLLISRKHLRQLSPEPVLKHVPNLWLGLAISVLIMILVVLPGTLTQAGIEMATSDG